jgi:hypothetical protein
MMHMSYKIIDTTNGGPLRWKIMKLEYIKVAFNINGIAIQFAFVIPWNENFNELKVINN